MARATLLVFTAASALLLTSASRDDQKDAKSDTLVSVSPRSFQQVSAREEAKADESSALAELRAQPEEKPRAQPEEKPQERPQVMPHAQVMPQAMPGEERSQQQAQPQAEAMSEAQMEAQAREDALVWRSQAEATMGTVAKASAGLTAIGDEARILRRAVGELGLEFGLDGDARRHEEQLAAQARARQHAELRVALLESASEKQRLRQKADELDQHMQEAYSRLTGDEVHSQAGQEQNKHEDEPGKAKESDEEEFAKLQKETQNIMGWFNEIKQLRVERDAMKAKKDNAVKAAANLGLSPAEIQRELTSASSAKAAEQALDAASVGGAETSHAAAHAKLDVSDVKAIQEQAEKMDAQSEQLANVMASSAIEMAEIETAAGDVMDGLDAFTTWKKRQSNSSESLTEAAQVKGRLSAALKYLEHHEHLVAEHANKLNTLMKNVNLMKI